MFGTDLVYCLRVRLELTRMGHLTDEVLLKERLSTVDLLVLTSIDQSFYIENIIPLFTTEAS